MLLGAGVKMEITINGWHALLTGIYKSFKSLNFSIVVAFRACERNAIVTIVYGIVGGK